jgi:nicotinamidase-related amidase
MKYKNFICIDLQNDFTTKGGLAFKVRPCIDFIKETLIPYFKQNSLQAVEIVSDYRQPRPGDRGDCCQPGEWGYESIIPFEIKRKPIWVKCMNSPIWVRENIGDSNKTPGIPYQDGSLFQRWLDTNVGEMNKEVDVVLFGLTIDCCVLSTAQELNWRGYQVHILKEAVDAYSGSITEKDMILSNTPLLNWVDVISWKDLI